MGTNNIDHRDGGDVSAIDTGLPAMAEIMKPQYGPDPIHDVVLLFGIDTNEELPVLDLHLKRAIRRNLKVIVAHPRHTELARYDAPHLQYTPGSEVLLLNALLAAATAARTTRSLTQPRRRARSATSSCARSPVLRRKQLRQRLGCWPTPRAR